ncbi:hypothetical protein EXE59_16620 [Nocardioides eburneiflavus]|uniref:Uncharacterized protein n=1 Tax=Nocardioides eburneiflavus TaxID=2518372 RepID=A0A4Z1CHZ4_9ACTN|nr:hypothetical protein [Nocardioides eburneiflavus]TGN65397.1 hypothetical protein EXE59_16620 [Nocardioides eburneiflavus]
MDAAWIGVIGGAVGAAGSLAGSVATQLIASRNAKTLKATDREALLQDRWWEEKRGVYMNFVETVTKAHAAFINLKLMAPERRHQSQEVDDLLLAFENILELMPRLSMLGSTYIRSAAQAQTKRILATVEWAGDSSKPDPDDDGSALEYVLWQARQDLGVGDDGAPDWERKAREEQWGLHLE